MKRGVHATVFLFLAVVAGVLCYKWSDNTSASVPAAFPSTVDGESACTTGGSPVSQGERSTETPKVECARVVADDFQATIVCLDRNGLPIKGVDLFLGGVESGELLGTTGEEGALILNDRLASTVVTTVHSEFVTETHALHQEPDGREELHLSRGASLSGRVFFADGARDFEDVRILACRVGYQPKLKAVERARDGHPSPLHLARADKHGAFEIVGLDPDVNYFVTAAGLGCIAIESVKGVTPGDHTLSLELGWLYGTQAKLVESGGAALRTSTEVGNQAGIGFYLVDNSLELAAHRRLEAVLAWLAPEELARSGSHEYLSMYVKRERFPSVGPMSISASIPGYASLNCFVQLPLLEGHLPITLVECKPIVDEWGVLEVRFTRAPELGTLSPRPQIAPGKLVLSDGFGELCEVRLNNLSASFHGRFTIPVGQYQGKFYSGSSDYTHPNDGSTLPVDLLSGEHIVEIPLEHSGAVQLELFDALNAPYSGEALVRVGQSESRAFRHVKFFDPPYILQGMEAGEYTIAAITGSTFMAPGHEPFRGSVEVREGSVSQLALTRLP